MYQELSIEAKREIFKNQLEVIFTDPEIREYFLQNISDETLNEAAIDDRLSNVIYLFLNSDVEKNRRELHAILDFSIKKIGWRQQKQIGFQDKSGKPTGASGPYVKGRSTLPMTTPGEREAESDFKGRSVLPMNSDSASLYKV